MYTDLKSFQQAEIIYDFTVGFCNKYIDKKSRTHDQMIQAARSGKQNIAEGTSSSKQKEKSEVYLLSIATASLKELLEDYKDFLRQDNLKLWSRDDKRVIEIRNIAYKQDRSYKTYEAYTEDKESAANAMICLINQTTYLLDQQIRSLEKKGVYSSRSNQLQRKLDDSKNKNKEFDKKLQEIIQGKRKSL